MLLDKYIFISSRNPGSMEFTDSDIETMKGLMWDYGLTKREAISYLATQLNGMTRVQFAKETGVTVSLITKRVRSAQEKINHGIGEEVQKAS